jgi:hypothetical protein
MLQLEGSPVGVVRGGAPYLKRLMQFLGCDRLAGPRTIHRKVPIITQEVYFNEGAKDTEF